MNWIPWVCAVILLLAIVRVGRKYAQAKAEAAQVKAINESLEAKLKSFRELQHLEKWSLIETVDALREETKGTRALLRLRTDELYRLQEKYRRSKGP